MNEQIQLKRMTQQDAIKSTLANASDGEPEDRKTHDTRWLYLLGRHDAPVVTLRDVMQAVNNECTCGGHPPGHPQACPACMVFHRINQKVPVADVSRRTETESESNGRD